MPISRRTLLASSVAAAIGSVLPGCGDGNSSPQQTPAPTPAPAATASPPVDAQTVLDKATDLLVTAYPETASSAGIDAGQYAGLRAQLTDRSAAGQAQIESDVRATLAQLKAIDTADLSADTALDVDVVRTMFATAAGGFDLPFGDNAMLNYNWSYRPSPYAVAQNTGAFVEIPSFLDASHKIESTADVAAYLSRLEAYAAQLDGESERVLRDGEKGYILPDFLLEKTVGQLRGALEKSPDTWGLVNGFAGKADVLDPRARENAAAIANDKIAPAIQRQIDALSTFASKATSDAGIWAKPRGEEYYAWALQAGTTTTLSPDDVHQMGLDELASLQARMDPILRSLGYTSGSVGERMSALGEDPRFLFSDGDAGRTEILTFIDDALSEIRALMPQAFNTLVPGFLEVTRIDPEVEAGAPGAYGGAGSIDGTKPGHFWINLRTPALHNKFNLKDLTYHEAIPGHVWQGEYTFKQPLIRSLLAFNAYSEGWALYAQQLADELGVYDEFPVGRLGYLQSLAFRACRLVVDTGLHAKRWTREQANQWFVTNNGSNPEEVRGEVDRYCAWPGQACGYKVGHTTINRLRDDAKAAMGERFDFKRFNDAVVLGGAVPMSVLERVVQRYIASAS
ncbi:MAG: DUF885 family protein [Gammaproteobacteria bacterium]